MLTPERRRNVFLREAELLTGLGKLLPSASRSHA
jgi:hypothetical protein